MTRMIATVFAGLLAVPAFASEDTIGDPEKGEQAFAKCKACHAVTSPGGDVIFKGGKTGPNLFGIIGSPAGSVEGYKYSKSLAAAGEAGLVWDAASFAEWLENPKEFLQSYLDDSKARSKMSFRLKSGGEDIAAWLASVGPEEAEEDATN